MASLSSPVSLHLLRLTPRRIRIQVTCGSHDNRTALQRGRVLSSESILAIQSLKRLSLSTNPNRTFPTSTFSRLLKPDIVAIISELNRQNQPHLSLMVFSFLRTDPSYKTDLSLYASLISSFGESESEEAGLKVDGLVSDLLMEKSDGFTEDERMKLTRVVRSLVKAQRGDAVIRVYQEMKRSGLEPDEYLFRVLFRGLKRLGKEEAAMEVERDFKEWWYKGSALGKMESEMKALDEMPHRDEELKQGKGAVFLWMERKEGLKVLDNSEMESHIIATGSSLNVLYTSSVLFFMFYAKLEKNYSILPYGEQFYSLGNNKTQ